jgi:hypothetical protein
MIVSGVEYIKDVMFLCMATTPAPVKPKGWYYKQGGTVAVDTCTYDHVTYYDASDELTWTQLNVDYSSHNWSMMMQKRGILQIGEKLLIGIVIALRLTHSKPVVNTTPVPTVVTEDDLKTTNIDGCAKHFLALTKEAHDIYAHVKRLIAEIKVLEASPPPAPAAAAGVLSEDERSVFEIVMTALGPWGRGDEIKDSIEMLVGFEKDMTDVIGTRVLPTALIRLRALVALEAGAKAAIPLATTDDPEALLKKIQDSEEQLKDNKVKLDEYADTQLRVQKNVNGKDKWDDVESTLEKLIIMNNAVNKNVPGNFKQNNIVNLQDWRKEFDKRQEQLEAYAKTQLEVQKALYDKTSWDEVLPEIKTLKAMCDVFVQQTPKTFNESNTLDIVKWRADYDRLVLLRDAMWATCTPAFKATTKIEDVLWVDEYKQVRVIMDRWFSIEAELLKILTPVPSKEIVPAITALVTLKTDTFAAIPESIKKGCTIDKITECVGLWSAAWTELVGFRQHVHSGLLFKEPKDNTEILTRFDDWMTNLKGIHDACGTVTLKQCPQLLKDIKLLVVPGDLGGSVAQIRTWKDEVARLTKLITDNEAEAKKAEASAAGGDGAATAAAEVVRTENVRLTSELGACEAKLGVSEDLVKAVQAKLSASEDFVKALQGANGRLEGLVAASDKEISKLTSHLTDGRTSAPPLDVADRVATLLVELNNLMPGRLTDRVDQDLIVQISKEIVAAFTGYEIKDVIKRLVSQLESAVHPGVRGESVSGMLADLEELLETHEKHLKRTLGGDGL